MDLWNSFWDLYTPDGIRWQDLYYYGLYTDLWFGGEELSILKTMDNAVHEFMRKKMKAKTK